jgi:HD-like signal output (HDOD) protein
VDEIDEKVYDEFKNYTEEKGKMQNHDKISNRLLTSWDMKDETTNKLLEIVIVDVGQPAVIVQNEQV